MEKLNFASDYIYGAHPAVLEALSKLNDAPLPGYGTDGVTEGARALIRDAAACPDAAVHFISGGTQANLLVIAAMLRSCEGVIAADTGHINAHEAGAIELTGHKVLTLPGENGKLNASDVRAFMRRFAADENRAHTVQPRLVYISQPTEYGTLYSLEELRALREVCDACGLYLYADGARLAYALASAGNDVSLRDLSALCDAYTVGGTKCGALFGEAVVIPDKRLLPYFFTQIKQHGALLAKGFALGAQFVALFQNGLYGRIGRPAIEAADRIREALREKGYALSPETPTNQIFVLLENAEYERLSKEVALGFWEQPDDAHTVARIATSWATTPEETDALLQKL